MQDVFLLRFGDVHAGGPVDRILIQGAAVRIGADVSEASRGEKVLKEPVDFVLHSVQPADRRETYEAIHDVPPKGMVGWLCECCLPVDQMPCRCEKCDKMA